MNILFCHDKSDTSLISKSGVIQRDAPLNAGEIASVLVSDTSPVTAMGIPFSPGVMAVSVLAVMVGAICGSALASRRLLATSIPRLLQEHG